MKLLSVILSVALFLSICPGAQAAESEDIGIQLIRESYDAIDNEDWHKYADLRTEFERTNGLDMFLFESEQAREERIGLFNIISVDVIDTFEFDLSNPEVNEMMLLHSHIYDVMFHHQDFDIKNVRAVLVTLDMTVYKEDMFTRNGFDARMEYLYFENGEWKLDKSSFADKATIEHVFPIEDRSSDVSRLLEIIGVRYDYSFWVNWEGEVIDINNAKYRVFENFENIRRDSFTPETFSDVDENMWYGSNGSGVIEDTYELGIIAGHGDGTFAPGGTLTVAEAVKMSAVVHNIYHGGSGQFEQRTPWYQVYVDYAVENGLIAADVFDDYSKPAARAEMAYIFARCISGEALSPINRIDSLPDVDADTPYAEEIFALYRAGVLLGDDQVGTFRPLDSITRAEASAIIVRIATPQNRKFRFALTN